MNFNYLITIVYRDNEMDDSLSEARSVVLLPSWEDAAKEAVRWADGCPGSAHRISVDLVTEQEAKRINDLEELQ